MARVAYLAAIGAATVVVIVGGVLVANQLHQTREGDAATTSANAATAAPPTSAASWMFSRASDPARTLVRDKRGTLLGTFTDGARTADLTGPARTFQEPQFTRATVTVNVWVRLAPQAWQPGAENSGWFAPWFAHELTDRSLDALGVAFQYVYGAPDRYDAQGVRYAGDAQFGPVSATDPDGRAENNDFYDYLGIDYSFPDAPDVQPHKSRRGDVDCSGFIRLVYGYRLGYPMRDDNTPGAGLPRRAFAMARYGPGAAVVPDTGVPSREYRSLQSGDLVFFNVDPADGTQVDHSGIFVGVDDSGHYRFISSRTRANGPTMGDSKYAAILDGDGHFATTFRTARRL